MSVLQFPRLYIKGEMSWDPGLANNNNQIFDPENVRLQIPASMPSEEAKLSIINNAEKHGIWNYFGTHTAIFENVVVSGASLSLNEFVNDGDPVINKPVTLRGMLVDIDAAAVSGSQIFYDQMTLGDSVMGLTGLQSTPMHARWIHFGRNLNIDGSLQIAGPAAVVWQTEIESSKIKFTGVSGSPVLTAFEKALNSAETLGIMIRFHTFRTLYFQNGIRNAISQQPRHIKELVEFYQSGANFSNPAYSLLAGVIGLWQKKDLESMPGKRVLFTSAVVDTELSFPDGKKAMAELGPTAVEIDESQKRLTLDLGATIPEINAEGDKVDIGDLLLQVEFKGQLTEVARLNPSSYAKDAYEQKGGLIDVDLSKHRDASIVEKLLEGDLVVLHAQSNKPIQIERHLIAVAAQRDVYLDEEESKTIPVRVIRKGIAVDSQIAVLICEYSRANVFIKEVRELECDQKGVVSLQLKAYKPGLSVFAFFPFEKGTVKPQPPTRLNTKTDFYVNVRTLPFDNALERSTSNQELTWSFIYQEIFKVYDVLNPVMSRHGIDVPLHDKNRMMTLVSRLRKAVSKSSFNAYIHMPVTRDMSAGKRKLVERWCQLVEDGENSVEPDFISSFSHLKMPDDFRRL